jgi:hypothetical protein
MQYTEQRSEPRYPIKAGFIEIDDRPHELDDLSTTGLGFLSDHTEDFTRGQEIRGFLVLQDVEEQYEMPVTLIVRRVTEARVGCSMSCVIPYQGEVITSFIGKLDGNGS